jgi:hypothetical protein
MLSVSAHVLAESAPRRVVGHSRSTHNGPILVWTAVSMCRRTSCQQVEQ